MQNKTKSIGYLIVMLYTLIVTTHYCFSSLFCCFEPSQNKPHNLDLAYSNKKQKALEYKDSWQSQTQDECAICLDNLDDLKLPTVQCEPCLHMFHHTCITNWINKKNICPICNKSISSLQSRPKRAHIQKK